MDEVAIGALRRAFTERFGGEPQWLARSPGRVNLIGEHTDYNEGLVLPMALDRDLIIAARQRSDRRLCLHSLDHEPPADLDLEQLDPPPQGWAAYPAAVAWSLASAGLPLSGWEGVIASEIPSAAGLSSSAALEMAIARIFVAAAGREWDARAMALLAQRAERERVGVQCGLMDQLATGCGRAGHALLIDCRSLEIKPVPLPAGTAVLVLDTGVHRRLADTDYNRRRRQCEAAARFLGVASLRDLEPARLEAGRGAIGETLYRRARHVLAETERAAHGAGLLAAGDAPTFGRFLLASHQSLAEDFEVSTPELDALVRCATRQPDCFGARLTGAGFGGCVVALARAETAEGTRAAALAEYAAETGRAGRGWVCAAGPGTGLVTA